MGFFDVFRRRNSTSPGRNVGAPFVMTLGGEFFCDRSGRVSDVVLAGGAKEVLAAGRVVAKEGRILEITNESPTYHPPFSQMLRLLTQLAGMGINPGGILVIVYDRLDSRGLGIEGTRYRVTNSPTGVELTPERE